MFKKLRNRFLVLNMSITSLVILTAFFVVYITTYNNIESSNQQKLTQMAGRSVMSTEISPGAADGGTGPVLGETGERGFTMQMISPDYALSFSVETDNVGNVLSVDSYIDMPGRVYQDAALQALNRGKNSGKLNIDGKLWLYGINDAKSLVTVKNGVQTVTTEGHRISFLDITDSQKTLNSLMLTFLIVGSAVLFVIFAVSYYFANRSVKPIAAAWENQRRFVADASHELKTPLSVITANYDALLSNQEETIRSQKEWLEYMKIGTDRMAKLINDLLSLAKMEDINIEVSKAPFNMSETVSEVMDSMEAAVRDKGLHVIRSIEPGITLNSDVEMVKQVFTILYENAVKYSDINGKMNVTLKKLKRRIICSIKNTGAGISKQDLSKIFDRFYRSDKSRTSEKSGYGLGLSIAKTVMNRLGGEITAESEESVFASFTFSLHDTM